MVSGRIFTISAKSGSGQSSSYSSSAVSAAIVLATAYHRIQWDIIIATYCSIHGTRLVDLIGGEKLGWLWQHFDVSPDGETLTDGRSSRKDHCHSTRCFDPGWSLGNESRAIQQSSISATSSNL